MSEKNGSTTDWNTELAIVLIPNNIVLSLFLIFGITGNILVIVIYRFRIKKSDNRFFVPILAASDLVTTVIKASVGLISNMLQVEFTNTALCKSLGYLTTGSAFNSIFQLTIIAAHRYYKVCRPFKKQMTLVWKRVAIFIGFCSAFALAGPTVIIYGSVDIYNTSKNITGHRCGRIREITRIGSLVYDGILSIMIIVCLTSLIILYSRIGHTIHKHIRFVERQKTEEKLKIKHKKRMSMIVRGNVSAIAIKPRSGSCRCRVNQSDSYEISERESELTGGNTQFKMYDMSERELGTAVTSKESENASKAIEINDNENTKSFRYDLNSPQIVTPQTSVKKTKHKISLIYMIITVMFLVCYIPKIIILFLEGYNEDFWDNFTVGGRASLLFLYRLSILGNAFNPFIYAIIDTKFRYEIRSIFRCSKMTEVS